MTALLPFALRCSFLSPLHLLSFFAPLLIPFSSLLLLQLSSTTQPPLYSFPTPLSSALNSTAPRSLVLTLAPRKLSTYLGALLRLPANNALVPSSTTHHPSPRPQPSNRHPLTLPSLRHPPLYIPPRHSASAPTFLRILHPHPPPTTAAL